MSRVKCFLLHCAYQRKSANIWVNIVLTLEYDNDTTIKICMLDKANKYSNGRRKSPRNAKFSCELNRKTNAALPNICRSLFQSSNDIDVFVFSVLAKFILQFWSEIFHFFSEIKVWGHLAWNNFLREGPSRSFITTWICNTLWD